MNGHNHHITAEVEGTDHAHLTYTKNGQHADGEHVVATCTHKHADGTPRTVYTLAIDTRPAFEHAEMYVAGDFSHREEAEKTMRENPGFPFGVLNRLRIVNQTHPIDQHNICEALMHNTTFSVTAATYPTRAAAHKAAKAPFQTDNTETTD